MTFARSLSLFGALCAVAIFALLTGGGHLAYAQSSNLGDLGPDFAPGTFPSGSDINCDIYAVLVSQGSPIPSDFDVSACAGGGGGSGGGGGDGGNGGGSTPPGGGGGGTGGGGGGNSGGPAPACEDNIDNDGDGLIDMNDPGCDSPSDNDETNGTGGGGSAAGGGGGGSATATSSTSGEVLGVSDVAAPPMCEIYLSAFIRPGAKNDPEQVRRLKQILVTAEGANLDVVSGEYDAQTVSAVHSFQTKYAADVLKPWGISRSTGFVYLTTRKKLNELFCKSQREFPLSSDELKEIAGARAQAVKTASSVIPSAPGLEKREKDIPPEPGPTEKMQVPAETKNGGSAVRSFDRIWRPITNFLNRVFGR